MTPAYLVSAVRKAMARKQSYRLIAQRLGITEAQAPACSGFLRETLC